MTRKGASLTSPSWLTTKYQSGDVAGKVFANVSMLPYMLILHAASRCYSRRDVPDCFAFLGLLLNELLARTLKHLLKHPRPQDWCQRLGTCSSPGMPSSHTQCMFFALALYALMYLRHCNNMLPASAFVGAAEVASLALGAAAVAYSRVYLHYHSAEQVLVGAVVGAVAGAAWFAAMGALARLFDLLAESGLGRLLHLKSTWNIAEPLKAERTALSHSRGSPNKRM